LFICNRRFPIRQARTHDAPRQGLRLWIVVGLRLANLIGPPSRADRPVPPGAVRSIVNLTLSLCEAIEAFAAVL